MARVLVVDDDFVSRRVAAVTLQRAGHTVLMASSGLEALGQLEEQHFDLMITDLAMPGMDGLSLLRRVRSDQRFAAMPVIMLTSSVQERDDVSARAEGISAFLTKPTGSRTLTEAVEEALVSPG